MRTVTGDCGRTGQSREGLIGGREELLDRFLLIGGKGLEALLSKPGHERACQLKFGESGYLLSEDFDEAALGLESGDLFYVPVATVSCDLDKGLAK